MMLREQKTILLESKDNNDRYAKIAYVVGKIMVVNHLVT